MGVKAKIIAVFPFVKSKLNFTWYFPNKQHFAREIYVLEDLLQQDSALVRAIFFDPV